GVSVDRRLFTENRGSNQIVDGGNVLDLLCEGTNALEFAVGWSKTILLFGHCFRRGNKLAFHNFDPAVEHLADSFLFLFCLRLRWRLRQAQTAQDYHRSQNRSDRSHLASK